MPDVSPLLIEAIDTTVLDIPLVRPHRFSVLTIHSQSVLLVRVRTAEGIVGIGEGVVPGGPWWGGESIEGMKALIDHYLSPLLRGQDAMRVDYLAHRMNRTIAGAFFAKSAVDMALWDARGQALDVPLYQLLGGAHRTELPVTWAVGADEAAVVIDEATEKLEMGIHHSFKLKMGAVAPSDDVARIVEVASALGGRAPLSVDLNGAWDEPTARRYVPVLADAGIRLIEQPLPAWDTAGAARLRDGSAASLMADESLLSVTDAQHLAGAHAADVFAVKLAKSGGIGAVQRIAAIAEVNGIACYGGTTIETSIGTAAAAHAFCACAPLTAGTELFGPLLLADDIAAEPVTYRNGAVRLPGGPGLGVVLDEAKVAKYTRA